MCILVVLEERRANVGRGFVKLTFSGYMRTSTMILKFETREVLGVSYLPAQSTMCASDGHGRARRVQFQSEKFPFKGLK
jgi:hypothetical protein